MHLVAEIIFIFLIVYLTGSSSFFPLLLRFFFERRWNSCQRKIFCKVAHILYRKREITVPHKLPLHHGSACQICLHPMQRVL